MYGLEHNFEKERAQSMIHEAEQMTQKLFKQYSKSTRVTTTESVDLSSAEQFADSCETEASQPNDPGISVEGPE